MNREEAINIAIGCVIASYLPSKQKGEVTDILLTLGDEECLNEEEE